MSATSKWSDEAVKDLLLAMLTSNNTDGSVVVNANWDQVLDTMNSWGYNFTKSAMTQHWSKKILKDFKERRGSGNSSGKGNNGGATATPKKATTPRQPRAPKTPGTGGSKRRGFQDDDDDSSPVGPIASSIARTKTPRPTSKKVKHEETDDKQGEASGDDSGAQETQTKAEEADGSFGIA